MSTERQARRRYEQMMRRLEELDRLDGIDLASHRAVHPVATPADSAVPATSGSWLAGPSADPVFDEAVPTTGDSCAEAQVVWPKPPRHRRRSIAITATMAVLTVVIVIVTWSPAGLGRSDHPPLPKDARHTRVLPVVTPTTHGPHQYMAVLPDGDPVTYDPCRPVHYVVNEQDLPDGGLALVQQAFDEISRATGLAFVADGQTDEPARADRVARQPDRYGNRWAPVLIAWTDEKQFPALAGTVAGVGGSTAIATDGPQSRRYVTGQVALDAQAFAGLLAAGRPDTARAILLHELGHVVGLGHVRATTELMHGKTGRWAFGPGDLQGLAALGAGRCHRDT
ncbi:MAG: hypothetical protein ACRC35_06630 [Angustibacter sp.]